MSFSVDLANGVIAEVLDKKTNVDAAAAEALKRNSELVKRWLEGVTTATGANGLEAVQAALATE